MVSRKKFITSNDGAYDGGYLSARYAKKNDWYLTQEAFDELLGFLDADRELAGQKYETIRRKLRVFFEIRGCVTPDEEADATINIVARRVVEGQTITGGEPSRYFYGVARNILREYWRQPGRLLQPLECLPLDGYPSENPDEVREHLLTMQSAERRLEALEQGLLTLSPEARDLILQYYNNCKDVNKKPREALAKRFGIPVNALRIRAHRIRIKLREHMNEYLETHPANEIDISL
ncbi:MAG: hypothetical protein WBV94_29105 [Blastocatellia bacterium]